MKPSLVEAALGIARQGTPVIPCHPLNKSPLIDDWPNKASTNEETIRGWWDKWPTAIIGSPTGESTNRVVIDVDSDFAAEELRLIAEQN
ncbi:MAG: bifunctional DNA primase/polymerase, partial [Candidatus Acidiferrum sp.]